MIVIVLTVVASLTVFVLAVTALMQSKQHRSVPGVPGGVVVVAVVVFIVVDGVTDCQRRHGVIDQRRSELVPFLLEFLLVCCCRASNKIRDTDRQKYEFLRSIRIRAIKLR